MAVTLSVNGEGGSYFGNLPILMADNGKIVYIYKKSDENINLEDRIAEILYIIVTNIGNHRF